VSYVTCAPTLRPTDGGLLAPRWWPVSAFPEVARRQQHRSPGGHHVQPQHRFTNPLGRSRGPGAGAGPALARPARDTPAHPAWSPAGRALFDRDREIEFDALRLVSTVRAVSAQPSDRPLRAETDDSEQRPTRDAGGAIAALTSGRLRWRRARARSGRGAVAGVYRPPTPASAWECRSLGLGRAALSSLVRGRRQPKVV
jgi:hypothetical protein